MTYCFKCSVCGHVVQSSVREPAPTCKSEMPSHDLVMRRDYQAESAGINTGPLKRAREAQGVPKP